MYSRPPLLEEAFAQTLSGKDCGSSAHHPIIPSWDGIDQHQPSPAAQPHAMQDLDQGPPGHHGRPPLRTCDSQTSGEVEVDGGLVEKSRGNHECYWLNMLKYIDRQIDR